MSTPPAQKKFARAAVKAAAVRRPADFEAVNTARKKIRFAAFSSELSTPSSGDTRLFNGLLAQGRVHVFAGQKLPEDVV